MAIECSSVDRLAGEQDSPRLPLEVGRPRVQRLVDKLAPVYPGSGVPEREHWALTVARPPAEQPLECELGRLRGRGAPASIGGLALGLAEG